ncbi:hypothetical protein Ahia01_001415200 [Argonauta hians]
MGGVAIYLHESITADSTSTFSNGYCESVTIHNKNKNILIAGIYRPPHSPPHLFMECLEMTIKKSIQNLTTPTILIMGDFNVPCIDWHSNTIIPHSTQHTDKMAATALLDFTDNFFLTQLVNSPTRNEKNTLDLVLTNNPTLFLATTVEKTLLSDHDMVVCNLTFHNEISKKDAIPNTNPFDLLDLHKADWEAIREDLSEIEWTLPTAPTPANIDASWEDFQQTITSICQQHTPTRRTNNNEDNNKNNIPKDRRQLVRKIKRTNKKIKKLKFSDHPNTHAHKIAALESEKHNIQLQIKNKIKTQRMGEERRVISSIKSNPRALFSFAKKHKTNASPIGPLINHDGTIVTDAAEMSEILQRQYCSVFSSPSSITRDDITEHTTGNTPTPTLTDISFNAEDIVAAINCIRHNSAAGPDRFPATVLKQCRYQLAKPLAQLWKQSLETAHIPERLISQTITPIYKKGNKSLPANYRPISLTSHLTKTFERIVRSRISSFLESNNLLDPNQHGFRNRR